MNNNSPAKAIIVVTVVAFLCSIVVTLTATKLQPIQRAYENLERNRHLVGISGLTEDAFNISDRKVIDLYQQLDVRIVDLDTANFNSSYNPATFVSAKAAIDPNFSVPIPTEHDLARLTRRSKLMTVYLVMHGDALERIILPLYGQGMWSTLYGFIALESDLNTIAGITFYEQGETAGIGDQILRTDWQARWLGRRLYDEAGTLRFRISAASMNDSASEAAYHVDAITGATVTTDAISNMVAYWFGPHGYAPFLDSFREEGER